MNAAQIVDLWTGLVAEFRPSFTALRNVEGRGQVFLPKSASVCGRPSGGSSSRLPLPRGRAWLRSILSWWRISLRRSRV